jgi:cell division protein ZapA (FtsZ GTPase activity inhibitor)
MARSDLRLDLLGTSFSITADEAPEYLAELLNRYKLIVERTQQSTGLKDPLKAAILTGFLLCDELQKLERGRKRLPDTEDELSAEQLTLDLIARIDEALENKTSLS